jgi:hypothetical protein
LKGFSDEVNVKFYEDEITYQELLALNIDGLFWMGIGRAGTFCLILKEIGKLERDSAEMIQCSPYCFSKILDHLQSLEFIEEKC